MWSRMGGWSFVRASCELVHNGKLACISLSVRPSRRTSDSGLTRSPALGYVCFHSDIDFGPTTSLALGHVCFHSDIDFGPTTHVICDHVELPVSLERVVQQHDERVLDLMENVALTLCAWDGMRRRGGVGDGMG